MTKKIFLNKNFLAALIIASSLAVAGVITQAAASAMSVSLEKNKISGFFTLSIRASSGIKEFVLYPPDKSSYGGGLSGCQKNFKSDNIAFADPGDFTPKMLATITDCGGESADFELLPSEDGRIIGKLVLPAVSATAEASTAGAPSETKPKTESDTKPKLKPENKILADVKFPVAELGSCQSEAECVSYCDDAAHAKVCIAFAKKNKIMSEEAAANLEKLADIKDGPGGCNSQKSCETYCSDIDKIDECFAFADKHNLLSEKDRDKIGKIKTALKSGAKLPGGCNNERSCESYCNDADHADECLSFGEQSGFLSAEEIEQYRKFSELRKNGETPGKCSSRESCEGYCNNPDNAEECIAFAEKAGFLSGEELAQVKKVLPLLKEGKTPGACRTKQQCEAYCEDENHTDECVQFGLEAGIISPQDAAMIKKTGGKGPGGCRSKEQCQTYCEQNQEACASWAKDNGLEGQFGGLGGGGFSGPGGCKSREECTAYCTANQEDQACKKMIEDFGGGGGGFQGGPGGEGEQGFQGGPGGCKSQEECMAYCQSHQEECMKFSQGGGEGSQDRFNRESSEGSGSASGFGGPGGCKSQEECQAYCLKNPDKCQGSLPPSGARTDTGTESRYQGSDSSSECAKYGGRWDGETCQKPSWDGYPKSDQLQIPQDYQAQVQDFLKNQLPTNYGGQGGCQSYEECKTYCIANPEDSSCADYGRQTPSQNSSQTAPPSSQTPQDYCSLFTSAPSCSYVGSPDSQNYKYCKQCFPDK